MNDVPHEGRFGEARAGFVRKWNGLVFWFDDSTSKALRRDLRRWLWKRFFWTELLDFFLRIVSVAASFLMRRKVRWSAYQTGIELVNRVRKIHVGDFKDSYVKYEFGDESMPMSYEELLARAGLPKEDRDDQAG